MKIAVIDDELYFRNAIQDILLQKYSKNEIDFYEDTNQLFDSDVVYDLLLLDIEICNGNGLDFALNNCQKYPYVIFVTSYETYAFDAYNSNVFGYVLKRSMKETLLAKIEQVLQKVSKEKSHKFFTELGGVKYFENKIIAFHINEGNGQIIMHTYPDVFIRIYEQSLSYIEKDLSNAFFKANRQTLVNVNYIKSFTLNHAIMMESDDRIIKVSRRNWTTIRSLYSKARMYHD